MATNAVNLQKAADAGANMASEKIKKEINNQTAALIELKVTQGTDFFLIIVESSLPRWKQF